MIDPDCCIVLMVKVAQCRKRKEKKRTLQEKGTPVKAWLKEQGTQGSSPDPAPNRCCRRLQCLPAKTFDPISSTLWRKDGSDVDGHWDSSPVLLR